MHKDINFQKFYAFVIMGGKEEVEYVECKSFEIAQDYFETLYGDDFTGEIWQNSLEGK